MMPKPVEETVRYGNGRIKYTGVMLNGEMHGAWSWYRTDGSLMRSGEFDRGRQIGIWRTFDRSGAVVKSGVKVGDVMIAGGPSLTPWGSPSSDR
jgi:antitoxin component YwqK of YwqJK toxin-antitoxin module